MMNGSTSVENVQGEINLATGAKNSVPHLTRELMTSEKAEENSILRATANLDESKPYGPLTQEEAEQLQREANEDTTRSEDLRQFLKEMHEKLIEEQQQHQQQQQLQNASYLSSVQPITGHPPVGTVLHTFAPSDSQYSLVGQPGLEQESDLHARRQSQLGPQVPGFPRLPSQTARPSLTDLTAPDNPPDGGWGWIVVLGSFCCMILVDGVCLSYGLLLAPQCGYFNLRPLSIIRSTNQTRSMTYLLPPGFVIRADRSLRPAVGSCVPVSEMGDALGTQDRALLLTPGALLIGLYLLLGPLVSALSNQFDFRPVAMAGAVVSTLALFLSSFATSINFLIATFGLLGGTGFALIYLPAIATVGHWFQQRRPLAVGLALCGSGVGCLLGAQAVPRLVDWLTWRGAMIILAAISFQCLSLIVLFRPLEVHVRISQIQRAKRAAREAARRASALRRIEAERVLFEARQRKRMAALAKAAEMQTLGEKHTLQRMPLERGVLGMNKFNVQTDISAHAGMGQTRGVRASPSQRGGRVGTVVTRNMRGGRILQLNPAGAGQLAVPRAESTRATGTGVGWLRNRSSAARGKRAPSRRVVVYRGSIMQRIIEEKRRQRTISVGSLDGMVITRDNELIAASLAPNIDRPLLSASAIHRISEAVARKIETKMQNQVPEVSTAAPVGASRVGLSRSQLRVSLPQVVQEYIQSQLSVALQQQQHKQSVTSVSPFYVSVAQPPTSLTAPTNPVVFPTTNSTVPLMGQSAVDSAQMCSSVVGQSTPLGTVYPNSNNLGQQGPAVLAPSESPSLQQHVIGSRLYPPATLPTTCGSNCPSESASLRRTVSDASLESRVQGLFEGGAGVSGFTGTSGVRLTELDGTQNGNLGPELLLLDDEIKAEIHARLKREMSRPQYKKDLFYTGSVVQLSSNQLAAETLVSHIPGNVSVGLISPSGILVSPTATGHRSQGLRASSTAQPPLDQPSETHNSQTNISVVTSAGTATSSFIPPAPCPPLQPQVSSATQGNAQFTVDLVDALTGQTLSQLPQTNQSNQEHTTPFAAHGNPEGVHDLNLVLGSEDRVSAYVCSVSHVPSTNPVVTGVDDQLQPTEVGHRTRRIAADPVEEDGLDIEDDGDDHVLDAGMDDEDDVDVADVDDGMDAGTVERQSHTGRYCAHCLNVFYCGVCASALLDLLGPMRSFVQELLSPWILTSVTFGFMLLSSTATMMGLVVPFVMLPDLLAELNWQLADSGFAICAIGVGNTVGRLVATLYIEKAWSATYRWADCLWLNNGSLFLTALTVFLMPLTRMNYSLLVLICGCFGLFSAVFVSLKSILVVELLGLDRLTNSFGYMLLFQGVAAIIGPPIAGHLRDTHLAKYSIPSVVLGHIAPVHHSTSVGFYFAGFCLLVACLLACPLRWISKREYAVTETRNSTINFPPDLTGPGYHGAFEFTAAPHAGDNEWLTVEPHQGLTNYAAYFPDAVSRNSDQPDYHLEQPYSQLVSQSQQQQQNTPPADALASQTTVTNSTLPLAIAPVSAGSTVPTAPGLVMDLGPPCMLSTIDETTAVDNSNVLLAGANTVACSTAVSHTPIVEDVTGLAATMLGVGGGLVVSSSAVPVVAPGTSPQTVEVMTVPEESGLEPVVEEEEEEDYEDDDADEPVVNEHLEGRRGAALVESSGGSAPQQALSFSSMEGEINPANEREPSSNSVSGTTCGSDSSQSREPKGVGDIPAGTESVSGQQTTWKRKKRKRAARRSEGILEAPDQCTNEDAQNSESKEKLV